MPLLNYTTQIKPEKTAGEIQKVLVEAGATGVMTTFENKIMTGITFQLDTPHGQLYYTLPANIDKIYVIMQRDNDVPLRFKNREQAARVAWRIIKDWIKAQTALVETEMAEMTEVFLPYMQTTTGESLYTKLAGNKFLLLEPPK